MAIIRNFLVSVGVFLLSWWSARLFFPISRFTNGIPHDDGVIGMITMGLLESLP